MLKMEDFDNITYTGWKPSQQNCDLGKLLQNIDAAFSRNLTIVGQLYLVIIVSDFPLLQFFGEQDQGPALIAGKRTPPEVFRAQRRSL